MIRFLSTPSARRATLHKSKSAKRVRDFYPRPPRGGRRRTCCRCGAACRFLSTPSARRATAPFCLRRWAGVYFYPRPPRGGRHEKTGLFENEKEFLSTPSARRATRGGDLDRLGVVISIHALREEGDPRPVGLRSWRMSYFYPRPPRGGRPEVPGMYAAKSKFLSTPSVRRATR